MHIIIETIVTIYIKLHYYMLCVVKILSWEYVVKRGTVVIISIASHPILSDDMKLKNTLFYFEIP